MVVSIAWAPLVSAKDETMKISRPTPAAISLNHMVSLRRFWKDVLLLFFMVLQEQKGIKYPNFYKFKLIQWLLLSACRAPAGPDPAEALGPCGLPGQNCGWRSARLHPGRG